MSIYIEFIVFRNVLLGCYFAIVFCDLYVVYICLFICNVAIPPGGGVMGGEWETGKGG